MRCSAFRMGPFGWMRSGTLAVARVALFTSRIGVRRSFSAMAKRGTARIRAWR